MNDAASTVRYLESWAFRKAFRPADAIARARAARASILPGGRDHSKVASVAASLVPAKGR